MYGKTVQLFAWADAMLENLGDHLPPVARASVENDLALIHSKLTASDFAKLSTQGQGMTVEEAVALQAKVVLPGTGDEVTQYETH